MGQKRPKIKLTVIDRCGKMGCHRGHRIGQTFDYDTEWGELCPMAMHCAFPYIDILRYGGKLPGQPEGVAELCCSDADTIMVFRAEVVKEEENRPRQKTVRYGREQTRKSVSDTLALFFYAVERADKVGEILLKCKKIRSNRMQNLLSERRELAA